MSAFEVQPSFTPSRLNRQVKFDYFRPQLMSHFGQPLMTFNTTASNQFTQRFAQTCPLYLSTPGTCPFGGICHSCPRRVQAKLTLSQPGDPYEKEADRVADQVMRMPEPCPSCREDEKLQTKPLADQMSPLVQRQPKPEEEEENKTPIELKVLDSHLMQKREDDEEEPIQTKLFEGVQIQRQTEPEEEEEPIPTKNLDGQTSGPRLGLANQVHALRNGGEPLPQSTCRFFESRFQQDFSQVRVHTNRQAAEAAGAINARAFTIGRDVVFGTGQYTPYTSIGSKLLAHELTHVIQQRGGHAPQTLQREQGGQNTPNTAGGGPAPAPAPPTQGTACSVISSNLALRDAQHMTMTQVTARWDSEGGFIIDSGDGVSRAGMDFLGIIHISPQDCGTGLFVQNVFPFREIQYKDGSALSIWPLRWHRDRHELYPTRSTVHAIPGYTTYTTVDSPGMSSGWLENRNFTEGHMRRIVIDDLFQMYFMFQPRGGARQSLQVGEWCFHAEANNPVSRWPDRNPPFAGGGSLVLDTSRSQITPLARTEGTATHELPVTSPNVNDLRYVVYDQSGGRVQPPGLLTRLANWWHGQPTQRSLAQLFEPVVNARSGPRH